MCVSSLQSQSLASYQGFSKTTWNVLCQHQSDQLVLSNCFQLSFKWNKMKLNGTWFQGQNKQNFLSTGLSTDFSESSKHACTSFVLTKNE